MKRSARMPATRLSGLATVAALSFTAIPWYAGARELVTFQEGVSPAVDYAHDATYIRSNPVDGNFDDDTDLELIVGTTTSDDVGLRSLLEFDIREIPAFSQIDSVSLELKTHMNTGLDLGGVEGNPTFNVYAYGFDIDELGSTWNDPDGDGSEATGDAMAGGTLGDLLTSASFDVTATEQWITFADSPEFQAAVSAAGEDDGILRLMIAKDDESTAGTHEFARFAADSSTTEGDRPALMVTYSARTDPHVSWPRRNDLGQRPSVPATTEGVVTIRNNGETKALTLSNWAVSGPDADHVTVSDGPSEIAPGGSVDLTYIFNSKNETGVFAATITFDSNDPNRPNAAIAISASVVNSAGPDGHYTFDDGTVEAPSVNDITGYGRHGSVDSANGSVSFGQASLVGGAGQSVSVDGGGAIAIPAKPFDDLTDYTVSAWVQLSAFPAELGSIFAKSDSLDTPDVSLLVAPDGSLIWLAPDTSADPLFSTDPLLKVGEAAMVTVVSTGNGDNVSVFVNGDLARSGQGLGEVDADPGVFYIGSFGPLFTSGLVDDLQISAKALSAEEIKQLADNPGTVLVAEQADSDGDGLTDAEEIEAGTDPVKADTDGDGLNDLVEVDTHGTNPLESDTDEDGTDDQREILFGTDPLDPESKLGTFAVRHVSATGFQYSDLDAFKEGLEDPSKIGDEIVANYQTINFRDNSEGNFSQGNVPFPLWDDFGARDDFGIYAFGKIKITEAGPRTFGVNSDDGFELRVDGNVVAEFPEPRGSGDTFGTADLTEGEHDLELWFYERASGAQVELFVNTELGEVEAFEDGNFLLLPAFGEASGDVDNDTLSDFWENGFFGNLDQTADGDPDGDGLANGAEEDARTDPNKSDSDDDGLNDSEELAGDPVTDPLRADTDSDGLNDSQEKTAGTDPTNRDTDGDKFIDGFEVAEGSDPLDPNSPGQTGGVPIFYENNFDFYANDETDLKDGSVLASSGAAKIVNQALQLTEDGTGGTAANFKLPVIGDLAEGFLFEADLLLSAEGQPADGFSFNYGEISDEASAGEEGHSNGLAVEFDTWNNDGEGAATGIGIDVSLDGNDVEIMRLEDGEDVKDSRFFKFDGAFHPISIKWDPNSGVTVVVDGETIYDKLPLDGFQPTAEARIAFGARTGGATETVQFDNMKVSGLFTHSVPEITGVSISADGVALQLPAGTTYDIEYSADLVTWEVIASDVTSSYTDGDAGRAGGETGFYRGVVK